MAVVTKKNDTIIIVAVILPVQFLTNSFEDG